MARLPQSLAKVPVGRERLSRGELDRLQRQRLLEAATEVFAKRGYQATTVDNIVVAAKVGVGGFYAHFDGKEECLLAAYEQIVAEARELVAAAVAAERSWARKALAALRELLALIAAEPLRARVALAEIQTGGPVALERYGEVIDFVIVSLAGGREVAGGLDPAPPATQEAAIANGLAWLLAQQMVRGEAKQVEALFEEMAELVLDPYLGAAQTRREIASFKKSRPGA
jgi:AcrR family transcriptional regulator